MQNLLSKALLEDICYPVSAVISMAKGKILNIHLFSSEFCGGRMCVDPRADEVWLMSNHESGGGRPSEADLCNLRLLRRLAGECRIRVFLTSEYYDCVEADLSQSEWNVL